MAEIQSIFNEHFAPQIADGALRIEVKSSKPVESANWPQGTKSNIFNILTQEGERIGVAHCHVDATGELLPGRALDPKALIFRRTLYTFYGSPEAH